MSTAHDFLTLRDRLQRLLEELPRLAVVKRMERVWWRRAAQCAAQRDEQAYRALLTEVDGVARALGVGRGGQINTGLAAQMPPAPPPAPPPHQTVAGPGLSGWGRPMGRRSVPSSWRRPQAPMQYPWSPEPPVSPPRRSDPCVSRPGGVPGFVDPYLARVRAEADAEREVIRRTGRIQYHGPDEPPTYGDWDSD